MASELASGLSNERNEYSTPSDGSCSPLTPLERAFVQRCMQDCFFRPPVARLLADDPYLNGRYRGG